MAEVKRIGDLEIAVDEAFQRHEWRAERVGWLVMIVIVLCGLLGLLGGHGLLSNATVGDVGAPLRIEYLRFVTFLSDTQVRMVVQTEPDQSEVRVEINQDYIDANEIVDVKPEPDRVEASREGQIYVFSLDAPGNETILNFQLRVQEVGLQQAWVRLDSGYRLTFDQYIYP